MILLVLLQIILVVQGDNSCPDKKIKNVKEIDWIFQNGTFCIGRAICIDGYFMNGQDVIVYNKSQVQPYEYNFNCTESKDVGYDGLHYKFYTFDIDESKTRTFPLVDPTVSYVFIGNYNATYTHPTIRVQVGLVGKAENPVLIHVQQSTESVGFELPLRVVGRDGTELTEGLYNSVTRELCADRNTTRNITLENLLITVTSNQPLLHKIHNSTDNHTELHLQIRTHFVQNPQVSIGMTTKATFQPYEDQWYYFNWANASNTTRFVVLNVTSADVKEEQCATVAIRNTSCVKKQENMGVIYAGDHMTMTVKGAMLVSRDKYPKHFYITIFSEANDSPCGLPAYQLGHSRKKTVEFNIHEHQHSSGFLFIPGLLIPISALLMIVGMAYISHKAKVDRTPTVENADNVATIDVQDKLADDQTPITTVSVSDIPRTHVQLVPVVIALIVLPFFCDVLSSRMEQYRKFGDLDQCLYNVECSFPIGPLPDVGRVASNLCYIAVGAILHFMIYLYERKNAAKSYQEILMGVQHDFDLLRGISYSVMLQGLLGFVHHLCPNGDTESLSNIFLLLSIGFTMQKIYQNRHPDTRDVLFYPVYITSLVLGLHGLLNLGYEYESKVTWIIFGLIHGILIITVPLQYVLLRIVSIFPRPVAIVKNLHKLKQQVRSVTVLGGVMGGVAVTVNMLMLILAAATRPDSFYSYLIPVYAVNMLLYLSYYVVMKRLRFEEKMSAAHYIIIALTLTFWTCSFYFLLTTPPITVSSAALSRAHGTSRCLVSDMFDGNDAWHLLSALSLFMTNYLVLVIDDNLLATQTSHILIF